MGRVDRGEIEHTGPRRHERAVGLEGQRSQQLAVQLRDHGTSVCVPDLLASATARIADEDRTALFVAEADRDDLDSRLGRPLRGVDRKIVVVLAIGDQDQRALRRTGLTEADHRTADRLTDPRTAPRHAMRTRSVERQPQKTEVGRHGRKQTRAPGEGDQPDRVVSQVAQ